MSQATSDRETHTPVLEIGYYHPTKTFASMREHIGVMDTSKNPHGSDGELIALFGPSQCGGATSEEAAETRRQAQLFIAAPDLLEACKAAAERGYTFGDLGDPAVEMPSRETLIKWSEDMFSLYIECQAAIDKAEDADKAIGADKALGLTGNAEEEEDNP